MVTLTKVGAHGGDTFGVWGGDTSVRDFALWSKVEI
jgi:hypothetical protein